jgi:hypothetical protein
VEEVAAAEPGVPIDLVAHSQGGVVTRLALIELEERHGIEWLRRLGLVATLGTPHGGADLATGTHAIMSTDVGAAVLDTVAVVGDIGLDPAGENVAQLSETSDLIHELAQHPIPDTVRAVSIAARGDLIVPVPRTAAPGATEVVVGLVGTSAHTALPGSDEANRELALALAGLPPGCEDFREALGDALYGEGVSYVEDLLGAGGWLLGWWTDGKIDDAVEGAAAA